MLLHACNAQAWEAKAEDCEFKSQFTYMMILVVAWDTEKDLI